MYNDLYKNIQRKSTENLMELGRRNAVKLFHYTAKRVPAYKDFLKKNSIQPDKIRSYNDLLIVPPVHKKNYLHAYEHHLLVPDGRLDRQEIISVSSGSSGVPFFWPRQEKEDLRATEFFDLMLHRAFGVKEESVLCIIGFAMGSWIAGPHCLEGMRTLNRRGTNITCITPGNKKEEIITILQKLSPQFDRTVLLSYPPFAKDVIDHAIEAGVDIPKTNLSYIFAGENFSEEWRDYLDERNDIKNPAERMFTIYGTADAGIIAHETPFTINVRRRARTEENLFKLLYQDDSFVPSLVSFYPPTRYIDTDQDKLLLTVDSGIPLVRYSIGDRGEVVLPSDIAAADKKSFSTLAPEHAWSSKLPMVTLRGRTDLAAIFYSANIFPENIKLGMESPTISHLVTGKFIVKVQVSDGDMAQSLVIRVQLSPHAEPSKQNADLIQQEVLHSLLKSNSEYEDVRAAIGEKADPIIELVEVDHADFAPGTKHKWLAKS